MRDEDERSGIARLVRGDETAARELRANLAVFGRECDDPDVRRLVADVLGGRRDVRDVLRSRVFNEVGLRRVANVERAISQLSVERRAMLFGPVTPNYDDFAQDSVLE